MDAAIAGSSERSTENETTPQVVEVLESDDSQILSHCLWGSMTSQFTGNSAVLDFVQDSLMNKATGRSALGPRLFLY